MALGILLVALAALVVMGITLPLSELGGDSSPAVTAWLSSHLIGLAIIATVWFLCLKPRHVALSSLGLTVQRLHWLKAGLLAVIALLLSLGATALYGMVVRLLGFDLLSPPEIPPDIVFSGLSAIFTFEALAFWTPLTEEVFFRGFVFAGLASSGNVPRAMVACALI